MKRNVIIQKRRKTKKHARVQERKNVAASKTTKKESDTNLGNN